MLVIQDIRLRDFDFWSGADHRAAELTRDQLDTIESHLEELYPDGMEETAINDFMWFEEDYIAEILGFDSWDELIYSKNPYICDRCGCEIPYNCEESRDADVFCEDCAAIYDEEHEEDEEL